MSGPVVAIRNKLANGCILGGGFFQRIECGVLGQEHLAGEVRDEMLFLQPVHHGAFDLGQVQLDAHILEARIDGLKRFQRTKVDLVDG